MSPAPCTRCTNFGRHCSVDPSFHRIWKRSAKENELERLKGGRFPQAVPTGLQPRSSNLFPGVPTDRTHLTDQALEDVKLGHVDIQNLIDHYYATFHPQFPILPDAATFISRYDANKLLLWSILSISAGGSPETAFLYNSLVNPVRRLAGDVYGHQSRGLELCRRCSFSVHGRFPTSTPSATRLQCLHRPPSLQSDFCCHRTRHEEISIGERELTWYGCFVINYTISMRLGIPSSSTSCQSIMSEIAKGYSSSVPETLLHFLHISYLGQRIATLLGDDGSGPAGLTSDPLRYIQLLDIDFQCTYALLKDNLSQQCKIFHLFTRLTLYSYAFNTENDVDQTGFADSTATEVSGKALATVTELLQLACASLVARTIPSGIAVGSLLETCQAGNSLVRLWSLFPKDSYSRISTHIARFIDFTNSKVSTSAANLHAQQVWTKQIGGRHAVTSRMSANVLFNVIWPTERAAGNAAHLGPGPDKQRDDTATQLGLRNGTSDQTFVDMTDPAYDDSDSMDDLQDLDSFDDVFADWADLCGNAPGLDRSSRHGGLLALT
ncbi:hypothetical protein EDD36DRAFT_485429 [Exophiala viscosa]|uniref:Transcription factor domain-containing protein n=1 Tax=Exophiala viscosa TaxID=2486360 RepID=A0AAN6E131_9EURO|nr:hypothetical protein EDD36DRAFT_485429 [Exophiala viscosa]